VNDGDEQDKDAAADDDADFSDRSISR